MNTQKLKYKLSGKLLDSQTTTVNATTTEIVTNEGYIALSPNALSIISENLKNKPLTRQSIDVVKAPSGGITAFAVPGLSGDEIQKEITGIILDYTTPRAYWDSPEPVEGTPPCCYSLDSVISVDGKPCTLCHYNEFGSKEGDSNAKACNRLNYTCLGKTALFLLLFVFLYQVSTSL